MNHSTDDDAEPARQSQPCPARTGGATARSSAPATRRRSTSNTDIAANVAPAGGLAISANDMATGSHVQLAHGALPDGSRLFSEAQSPPDVEPDGDRADRAARRSSLRATQPMFDDYALGWDVQDYRGARLVWHGGAVFGSLAAVAMLPERNVGIYIAVNSEEGEVVRGLMYELLDHYLGLPRDTWPEKLHRLQGAAERGGDRGAARAGRRSRPQVGPSLPLARYAGDFTDPWYGTINVREENGHLTVAFPHTPGLTATLDHWQYDTFVTHFNDPVMEPAYVTFQLDAQGHVDRITMQRDLADRRLQLRLSGPAVPTGDVGPRPERRPGIRPDRLGPRQPRREQVDEQEGDEIGAPATTKIGV